MKLKVKLLPICVCVATCFSGFSYALDITQSSQNEIFENPFIVTGFNKKTNQLTGFITILRPSPGRTDECKIAFSGQYEKDSRVKILLKNAVKNALKENSESSKSTNGEIRLVSGQAQIVIDKKDAPGDCDWISGFVDEDRVTFKGNAIYIQMKNGAIGDWIAVSVIKSPKAYFHKNPDGGGIGKAYLTTGDLAYIFDEQPGWYFVKFQGRKKETVGWIKKTDMIQF